MRTVLMWLCCMPKHIGGVQQVGVNAVAHSAWPVPWCCTPVVRLDYDGHAVATRVTWQFGVCVCVLFAQQQWLLCCMLSHVTYLHYLPMYEASHRFAEVL